MVPEISTARDRFFFCHLRPFFPHFTPLTAQKLKSSKNEKNTRRYHHFPQVYQKSWSCYTVPEVWHVTGVIVVFHLGLITPLTARKMKRSRKWKKLQEISSFYISAPTLMIICHTGPEICCVTDVIVIFHFGLFFPLLSP